MIADGYLVGDGSWELRVFVTDLQVERTLRVKGDLHIGGVIFKLVEDLDIAVDWSDHALWWPRKNQWLSRTRSTLDQYGVQADAILEFTPMHKTLRVQLPDLRYLDCRVDFSIKTFNAVVHLCKDLGMRHPEELSLCKPLFPDDLRYNYQDVPGRRRNGGKPPNIPADTNTFIATHSNNSSLDSSGGGGENHGTIGCAPVRSKPRENNQSTPISSPVGTQSGTWKKNHSGLNGSYTMNSTILSYDSMNGTDISLAQSPTQPSDEAKARMVRPRSLVERARINVAWLDSSLSIMEQGAKEFDTLLLRYKFYSFYDLNPKYDAVRINQIYEQAKWQLLNEEIDCTEEEMLMFAALQLQVNLQANVPQPDLDNVPEDDIDAALTDLQVSLEGSHVSTGPNDIMHVPELGDYLRFMKPKRFTLKSFKRYWVVCRDLHLTLYKSREEETQRSEASSHYSLRGCEVTPDVNLAQEKYGIRLEVPGAEGMTELWMRCDSEQQYARWLAACRLAAKGKSLADSSYEPEVRSILAFLSMQHPAPAPVINPASLDISADDYMAQRFLKKGRGKLVQRILEAHANVKDCNLVEAKMNYIKAWQTLPEYGITLFVVKFMGHKKEELLGVAFNRIMRMDMHTGDHIKTWRYNTMKAWNVNWEVKHMMVQFEEGNVIFGCLSADCKVVHEFIGGYIFLSMRSKEASQTLNEELFHKLTGGWV